MIQYFYSFQRDHNRSGTIQRYCTIINMLPSPHVHFIPVTHFVTQSLYLLISFTYFFPCLHPASSLTTTSLFWAESLNEHFPGKTYRWPTGRKRFQISLITEEVQIKTIVKCQNSQLSVALIKS